LFVDSELDDVAGHGPHSMTEQIDAVRIGLTDTRSWGIACQLVVTHRPAFSNGKKHPNDHLNSKLVDVLKDQNVEMVISGHEHVYERLGPINETKSLVQVVAGTGGADMDGASGGYTWLNNTPIPSKTVPNGDVREANSNGVVRLMLKSSTSYDVEFWEVDGSGNGTLWDKYSGTCKL
jgi:acid phosphatase type 7